MGQIGRQKQPKSHKHVHHLYIYSRGAPALNLDSINHWAVRTSESQIYGKSCSGQRQPPNICCCWNHPTAAGWRLRSPSSWQLCLWRCRASPVSGRRSHWRGRGLCSPPWGSRSPARTRTEPPSRPLHYCRPLSSEHLLWRPAMFPAKAFRILPVPRCYSYVHY